MHSPHQPISLPKQAAAVQDSVMPAAIHPPMVDMPPTPGLSVAPSSSASVASSGITAKQKAGGYKVPLFGALAMPKVMRTRSAPGSPRGGAGEAALPPLDAGVAGELVGEKDTGQDGTVTVSVPPANGAVGQGSNALGLVKETSKGDFVTLTGENEKTVETETGGSRERSWYIVLTGDSTPFPLVLGAYPLHLLLVKPFLR